MVTGDVLSSLTYWSQLRPVWTKGLLDQLLTGSNWCRCGVGIDIAVIYWLVFVAVLHCGYASPFRIKMTASCRFCVTWCAEEEALQAVSHLHALPWLCGLGLQFSFKILNMPNAHYSVSLTSLSSSSHCFSVDCEFWSRHRQSNWKVCMYSTLSNA